MGNWVIVAVLLSVLATVWLAWLLYRINQPPEARKRARDGGDASAAPFVADGGGRSRADPDSDSGSDGGGGDGGGD